MCLHFNQKFECFSSPLSNTLLLKIDIHKFKFMQLNKMLRIVGVRKIRHFGANK